MKLKNRKPTKTLLYKIIIKFTSIKVYKKVSKELNKIKIFHLIIIPFYLKE